jgi:hypothetical protein
MLVSVKPLLPIHLFSASLIFSNLGAGCAPGDGFRGLGSDLRDLDFGGKLL